MSGGEEGIGYRFRDWYVPERMMPGLERWVVDHIAPGSFLSAVLRNDLIGACSHADIENARNLPAFVAWLVHEAPSACYGSSANVDAWAASRQP